MHKTALAACLTLFLIAPAQAQDKDLFLVLYMGDSTSPAGLVDAPQDRAACERKAVAEQVAIDADGSNFRVKCEFRGPNDMLWKLKPWLRDK